MMKKYNSAKEFIVDLMDNEGTTFTDVFGRRWLYDDYEFWFSDVGEEAFVAEISCLHLYGIGIRKKA